MTTTTTSTPMCSTDQEYDRLKDVKQFDDSKAGVKGLVDSGLTSIPRFFIHPTETQSDIKPITRLGPELELDIIPTVDLSGVTFDRRSTIVEQISRASRELGFFQIVNHGVPMEILERAIGGIKGFHEQPTEEKARWYRRETGNAVMFFSNVDLFHSQAASWRSGNQFLTHDKMMLCA